MNSRIQIPHRRRLATLWIVLGSFIYQGCSDVTFGGSAPSTFQAVKLDSGRIRSVHPDRTATVGPACTDGSNIRLMAGQHHDAGNVVVTIAADGTMTVKITARDTVQISETHVDVAGSLAELQKSPGQFRYKTSHNPPATEVTHAIKLSDHDLAPNNPIFMRVHAVVAPEAGEEGEVLNGQETAWADGGRNGIGWSMYFVVDPEGCDDLVPPLATPCPEECQSPP